MKEVGVGLEKASIKEIPEGITEVVVYLYQVQEIVLMEKGSDVTNAQLNLTFN